MGGVPCHGELMRIVRWHNNAFALHPAMSLPVHMLHYDDFNKDFQGTIDKLMEFLNLPRRAEPMPFLYSSHDEYYKPWERVKMSEFITAMSSPQTLKHLQRYISLNLEQEQKKAEAASKNYFSQLMFYN